MALGIGWKNTSLQLDGEQPKPSIVYFWVLEKSDGSVLPEYDLETAAQNQYGPSIKACKNDIVKVHWYPFSAEFADQIFEVNGVRVVPTNNPILSVDIPKNCKPKLLRRGFRKKFTYYECLDCGNTIYWTDTSIPLHCPNCEAVNKWFCNTCKVEIEHPIFLPNGETRCPICETKRDPRGCNKDEHLRLMVGFESKLHYCIGIDKVELKEYDDTGQLFAREQWTGKSWEQVWFNHEAGEEL